MGNTNRFTGRRPPGSWQYASTVYGKRAGNWLAARYVYARSGGVWRGVYSVLSATMNGNIAHTGSGASSSGTASAAGGVTGVSGNIGGVSYGWSRISSYQGIEPNNSGIAQPTWSRSFSGVSNGTTSGAVAETWQCTITDGDTGATTTRNYQIEFAWQNTLSAFTPFTQYFTSGSSSVGTPAGAGFLTIRVVGGGAQGGAGFNDGMGTEFFGGGASGAGQAIKTISPSGTYSYSVGSTGLGLSQGGTSSVSGAGVSMYATGGYPGQSASGGGAGGAQNAVGGASGGDANYSGNAGYSGYEGGSAGGAGAGGGPYNGGNYYGRGGQGGGPFTGGEWGTDGIVIFEWGL